MATEIKDIGDIVKKCKILLLDIEGTTTSISFVKDKLFPYAEENLKSFLESQWETNDVKDAVNAMRKLSHEDETKNVEGVIVIPGEDASKEEQIEGLVKNVKWQMSSDRKAGPLKHLQGLIWKQAFDKGEIKGHVYDDVSAALEQWHGVEGQKIYIYSSGSVEAQKLLFEKSLAGNLLLYIDGHFDTSIGPKQEIASYTSIIEKIGCKADEILFLTDIVKEAEAARSAGMFSALVCREGNAPLSKEATDAFAVIHSFVQLTVSNKRKTDPQDEQPAKIPKTDNSSDVTNSDVKTALNNAKKVSEEMEVEEENTPLKEGKTEEKIVAEEPSVVVEDITDSNPTDVPVSSVEPIITEICEKEETEHMETDTIEPVESAKNKTEKEKTSESVKTDINDKVEVEKNNEKGAVDVAKQNLEETLVDQKVPTTEETLPVITEIEEITDDKENVVELRDIVDDIEPVVEEPVSEILEELQNAGKELDKECVDILNKVQNVTNLDNIPLKQQLNPIIEESMESDNEPAVPEAGLEKEMETEITQSIQTTDSDKLNKEKVKEGKAEGVAQDISTSEKDNSESVENKTECIKKTAETDKDKVEHIEDKSKSVMDMLETPEQKDATKSGQNLKTDIEKNNSTEDKKEPDQPVMVSSDGKIESIKNNKDVSESTKEKQETVKEKIEIAKENGENKEHLEETSSSVPITTEEKIQEGKLKQEETSIRTTTESSSKDIEAMDTDKKENPTVESPDIPKEEKVDDKTKIKEDKKDEDKPTESSDNSQVNGKTNGEAEEEVTQNGDINSDVLSSRLSVENGKEVNGSNGDSMDVENGPEEQKDDKKDAEIKVKTVSTDEPLTEPVEQHTEA